MTQDSKTSGEQAKCLTLLESAKRIFYDRLDDAIRSASMFDETEYKAFCQGSISFGNKEEAQKKKEIYNGIVSTVDKVVHDNERLILRLIFSIRSEPTFCPESVGYRGCPRNV
mgnify:CR=1 FL=1